MAGIYVHIPFCRQACTYCDFHFSTNLQRKADLAAAIAREAELRRGFFAEDEVIRTVYFGGGTPSLLEETELRTIYQALKRTYQLAPSIEFTFECNPDDLSDDKLKMLHRIGVNRLSIGVQSFIDRDLKLMGRYHNAREAFASIQRAQELGFSNLTVDLIYGIPDLGEVEWRENVQTLIDLGIPHISAYALTVEEKTALAHQVARDQVVMPRDEVYTSQFFTLIDMLTAAGFEHYELSNFARPGFRSQHNSAYWDGVPYLGLGPSAHSFRGNERSWNVANNARYLKAIAAGEWAIEEREELSRVDQVNEFLLTQLRRTAGIERAAFRDRFGYDPVAAQADSILEFQRQGWLKVEDGRISLTRSGLMVSNHVIGELFLEP